MSKQNRINKKKQREKESHKKVLIRRAKIRAKRKEAEALDKLERESMVPLEPIRNDSAGYRDAEIMRQMQHNMEILKALEDEYELESQPPMTAEELKEINVANPS